MHGNMPGWPTFRPKVFAGRNFWLLLGAEASIVALSSRHFCSFVGVGGSGSEGSGAIWGGVSLPWGAVWRHEEEGGPGTGHHQGQ